MRWPYRHPHTLTKGMRLAQHNLSEFATFIDWKNFKRKNISHEIKVAPKSFKAFACGNRSQVLIWGLKTDKINNRGLIDRDSQTIRIKISIPGMDKGAYTLLPWNTIKEIKPVTYSIIHDTNGTLTFEIYPVIADLAMLLTREMD